MDLSKASFRTNSEMLIHTVERRIGITVLFILLYKCAIPNLVLNGGLYPNFGQYSTPTVMKKLLALSLLLPFLSSAQYGVLDGNFDADGKVEIGYADFSTRCHDVLVQPDGKILVSGWSSTANLPGMFINRMWPDGSPDNDFGIFGQAVLHLNGLTLQCYAMALQDDGKIIMVGGVNGDQIGQIVIRLNANDGFADQTFGINGYTIIPYPGTAFLYDVVIQDDGKIVATGISTDNGLDVTVVRLNADGSMDNTFSFDGKVITDAGGLDAAQGIAIDPNGKIVVAGSLDNGGGFVNSLLVRYNSNGDLDNTFGTNGISETSLAPNVDKLHNVSIDGAGNIYGCGTLRDGDYNIMVAKFNGDGSLNNSFSFDGIVEVDVNGDDDEASDILIQPDSKLLVAGSSESNGDDAFTMVRLMPEGLQDITFGNSGIVVTSSGSSDEWQALALQDDLKILAAGTSTNFQFNLPEAVVARFTSGMNVGIGDLEAYIGSTLTYPNPVLDRSVTVEYELKKSRSISIDLFNAEGKLVENLSPLTQKQIGPHVETLQIPETPAGQYLLRLGSEKEVVTVKLQVK